MPSTEPGTGGITVGNEDLPLKMLSLYGQNPQAFYVLLQGIETCPMRWEEQSLKFPLSTVVCEKGCSNGPA